MEVSFEAMAWAARQKPPTSTGKLCLLMMASMANEKGQCWPSHNYLADQCMVSRRTILNTIRTLADNFYIEPVPRFRKKGGKSSNLYTLLINSGEHLRTAMDASEQVRKGSDVQNLHIDRCEMVAHTPCAESAHDRNSHSFKQSGGKGTRLSEEWQPNEKNIEFCKKERPDLNVQKTGDAFRDYWIAVSGQKGVKRDWDATWRNWVRRENGAPQQSNGQHDSPSYRKAKPGETGYIHPGINPYEGMT